MKNELINKKSCENCKYYLPYYIKRGINYCNIHSGHCTNEHFRNKRIRLDPVLCEYWEDFAIKKEERKRDIKTALISMSERLDELTLLLNDDMKLN